MTYEPIGSRIHPNVIILAISAAIAFSGATILIVLSPARAPVHSIAVKLVGPEELVWTEKYGGGPAELDDGLQPLLAQFFAVAQKQFGTKDAQLVIMSDGTLQFKVSTDKGWTTLLGRMNIEEFISGYELEKHADVP